MLTAAFVAVSFLGWTAVGLPFLPFDLFDWIARILPGSVVTAGIDATVAISRAARRDEPGRGGQDRRTGRRRSAAAPGGGRGRRCAAVRACCGSRANRRSCSARILGAMLGGIALVIEQRLDRHRNRPGARRTVGVRDGVLRGASRWAGRTTGCRASRAASASPPAVGRADRRRFFLQLGGSTSSRRWPRRRAGLLFFGARDRDSLDRGHALVRHASAAERGRCGHARRRHASGIHAARPSLPRRHEHARAADRRRGLAAASRRSGPASADVYAGRTSPVRTDARVRDVVVHFESAGRRSDQHHAVDWRQPEAAAAGADARCRPRRICGSPRRTAFSRSVSIDDDSERRAHHAGVRVGRRAAASRARLSAASLCPGPLRHETAEMDRRPSRRWTAGSRATGCRAAGIARAR